MQKRIDSYLAPARAIISDPKNEFIENNVVPKVYKSYIAAFGSAILQSGIRPAVLLYMDSSRSEKDKKPILNAVYYLFTENQRKTYFYNHVCL